MKRSLFVALASLALSSMAQAHSTGHEGSLIDTVHHLATQPYHLVVFGLAIAAVAIYATKRLRSAKK